MKKVSLIQQLWMLVVAAIVLAAAGSLTASLFNSRDYLQQQLAAHGNDAANSLALMITQNRADKVMGETLINAAFDQGHYRRITWVDINGKSVITRHNDHSFGDTPQWFRNVFTLSAKPGRAMVSSGWTQAGYIEVESEAGYAYVSLWEGAVQVALWVGLAGVLVGLIGSVGVNGIRRQLLGVVNQAKSITQRRFVTIPEPSGPEMGRLAQAMNAMVVRVKAMFEEEAQRLEVLRRQINFDAVTGVANRQYFMGLLGAGLEERDRAKRVLVLMRIETLAELNAELGRPLTDELLKQFGALLRDAVLLGDDSLAARLNGSDFALLLSDDHGNVGQLNELHQRLRGLCCSFTGQDVPLGMAATEVAEGDQIRDLMSRLDQALAQAEAGGSVRIAMASENVNKAQGLTVEQWTSLLDAAVRQRELKLVRFVVRSRDGRMLHEEAPLRLQHLGEWLPAGQFMPMAIRTRRVAALDLAAVALALEQLATAPDCPGIAVNLAAESLNDENYVSQLVQLIRSQRAASSRLWLEMAESGIMPRFDAFRALCLAVADLPCKLGIEHFGRQFSLIGQLHDLGIDYLKIDGSFVQDVHEHAGNQAFLKGVCNIAHNIGLGVIAEGVKSDQEQIELFNLGFDGVTGPAVR